MIAVFKTRNKQSTRTIYTRDRIFDIPLFSASRAKIVHFTSSLVWKKKKKIWQTNRKIWQTYRGERRRGVVFSADDSKTYLRRPGVFFSFFLCNKLPYDRIIIVRRETCNPNYRDAQLIVAAAHNIKLVYYHRHATAVAGRPSFTFIAPVAEIYRRFSAVPPRRNLPVNFYFPYSSEEFAATGEN